MKDGDEKLIEDLYHLTNGTPEYMDMCYKRYLQLINKVDPRYKFTVDDFGKNTENLAKRYLRDMDSEHQDIVRKMCCLPNVWEVNLYEWVVKADYCSDEWIE